VASEVYSYGVVLLELLQGQRVEPKTASKVRRAIETGGAGKPLDLAEAACTPVWQLVQCL
jgi:hypothetical protein